MKKILAVFLTLTNINCYADNWVCINRAVLSCNTWRLSVYKGWLVASDNAATGGEHGYAMSFVPDENHDWKI